MTYETFEELIKRLEFFRDRSSKLYDIGVSLCDYEEPYHEVFTILLTEFFGKDGYEWVSWYLYERSGFDGKILQAWDKNNNEICYDIPSLWAELQLIKRENITK